MMLISPSVPFSFRFICEHSTNIPEVRGHAFHYGKDPCPWGSPSSALHRIWVSSSQIPQTHVPIVLLHVFMKISVSLIPTLSEYYK